MHFEKLWFHDTDLEPLETMRSSDNAWVVYFTASWCGACKRLDCDVLDRAAAANRGLTLWKCDVTVNDYTGGYCGIKSFPTFMLFTPDKIVNTLKSSTTAIVENWINTL